jgi:hypothetical protein
VPRSAGTMCGFPQTSHAESIAGNFGRVDRGSRLRGGEQNGDSRAGGHGLVPGGRHTEVRPRLDVSALTGGSDPHGSGPCGGGWSRDNDVTTNVWSSGETGGSRSGCPRCESPGQTGCRAFEAIAGDRLGVVQVRVSLWTWGFKSPLAHADGVVGPSAPHRRQDHSNAPAHPRGRSCLPAALVPIASRRRWAWVRRAARSGNRHRPSGHRGGERQAP